MTCREGLELTNSLVRGTAMEGEIKEWKKRHLPHQQSDDEDDNDSMLLGQKDWNNFCSRHSNQLSAKRAVRFDSNRDDWCTVKNFELMYQKVYNSMVDCGVAIKWEDGEHWVNNENEPVELEKDAYGRKTAYSLMHPEKVLFVDEVGCNTSQKSDGNIGGEKFLVDPDSQARI